MSLAHKKFVISSCILGHQFTVLVWKHTHTHKQPNSYQNSMFKEWKHVVVTCFKNSFLEINLVLYFPLVCFLDSRNAIFSLSLDSIRTWAQTCYMWIAAQLWCLAIVCYLLWLVYSRSREACSSRDDRALSVVTGGIYALFYISFTTNPQRLFFF